MSKHGGIATWLIRGVVLLFLMPVLMMVFRSLTGVWRWPVLMDGGLTLQHWRGVFLNNPRTYKAIGTSIQIGILAVLMNAVIAIPAADALARYSFRGKAWIETLLFAPIIVPPLIVLTGIHLTFIRWGLTEHIAGVVLGHLVPTLPYMIRAVKVSFEHLGFALEDQARVLGARGWQRFWWVVFPQILPGVIAGASLTLLISLSQYIITVLIGGGHIVTIPVLMIPYISGGDQGIGAVYALLFAAVAIGLLLVMDHVLKRYYAKGGFHGKA